MDDSQKELTEHLGFFFSRLRIPFSVDKDTGIVNIDMVYKGVYHISRRGEDQSFVLELFWQLQPILELQIVKGFVRLKVFLNLPVMSF
jgi:hypothetical protein